MSWTPACYSLISGVISEAKEFRDFFKVFSTNPNANYLYIEEILKTPTKINSAYQIINIDFETNILCINWALLRSFLESRNSETLFFHKYKVCLMLSVLLYPPFGSKPKLHDTLIGLQTQKRLKVNPPCRLITLSRLYGF